jgi:regulator of protease activity HflC (stomatin/prohibitin superfamily)
MNVELARSTWARRAVVAAGLLAVLALLHLRLPATVPVPWLTRFFSVPPASAIGWAVDIFGFITTFVIGLVLISQFALPVQTWDERVQAISRIFEYAFGSEGPVVFVKDGKLIASRQELKRGGAGVVLADSTSAVVLERGARFSRAEGPGIVFLRPGERICATLDLRRQARSQPAAALTKDGIEVKTTLSVTFGLATPNSNPNAPVVEKADRFTGARHLRRQYAFDPQSAFRAIYGTAAGKDAPVLWTELPLYVASERFRSLLARQTLDDLFRPADPKTFPLQDFLHRLTEDVRNEPVLRERGIEVFSVSVAAFDLPSEVMKQRIASWESTWDKKAQITLAAGDTEGEKIKHRIQYEAQAEVVNVLRAAMKPQNDAWTVEEKERTMRRIIGALRSLASPFNRRFHSGDALRILAMLDLPREALQAPADAEADAADLDRLAREPLIGDEPDPASATRRHAARLEDEEDDLPSWAAGLEDDAT